VRYDTPHDGDVKTEVRSDDDRTRAIDAAANARGSRVMAAVITEDDDPRLTTLHEYGIVDSRDLGYFLTLVINARAELDMPMAAISLVTADRQWFKTSAGMGQIRQTLRAHAFCAHTIESDDPFVVTDAHRDARFADNPLVTGFPHIRFYAGAPIIASNGHRLGAFCVMDTIPRRMSPEQVALLRVYAGRAMRHIEIYAIQHPAGSGIETVRSGVAAVRTMEC
jgi:GAF domain-containing protein